MRGRRRARGPRPDDLRGGCCRPRFRVCNALCPVPIIRLSTAVEITYHYFTDFTIYFVASPESFAVWIRRRDRSANHPSIRPPTTERHLPSLYSSSAFFPLHDIRNGPSSSKRPGLSKPQQDSEDPRSERERHDETTRRRQEHRTERHFEPSRIDRFRTSVSLIRVGVERVG